LPQIGQSPGFAALPPELQRYLTRQVLTEARKGARDVAGATHPDLATQATLKGLDPDLRDYVGLTRKGQPQAPGAMDFMRQLLGR
jgi:hypothetical protein